MSFTLCKNRYNYTKRNKQPRNPLSTQPYQNRTIPRFAPTPLPFNERSACFASLRNSGRSTSGIHASPRKRVRFCCSVKPSQLWWGLFLVRTINEIFRTIPRFAPTPLPCLPLPLHLTSPSPQPLQKDNNPSHRTTPLPPLSKVRCCRPKEFGRLPEGLPYHHLSPRTNPSKSALSLALHQHPCLLMNAPFVLHPHYPSKSTTLLPPLSKGGGLTARHKLLSCCVFTCDMFTFLIYQTFLPSRRRDCHTTIFRLAPTIPKPHYPLPCTITLASPFSW